MKPHERIGPIARALCYSFEALVIGGAVDYVCGFSQEKPKDLDIVVPLQHWPRASRLVPEGSQANKFGGFKFMDGEFELDVWAGDLGVLLRKRFNHNPRAYCPDSGLMIHAYVPEWNQ